MRRLGTLVLLATALTGCSSNPTVDPDLVVETPSAAAARVEVVTLQSGEVRVETSLSGEVEGSRDATLASAMGGYVESVRVREGQRVNKGATLALIDSEVHGAALDRAKAQLEQARSDLERLGKLGDLASAAQTQQLETQVKIAEAGVRQAQATYRRAIVSAPFAGTVADVAVEAGEVAGPGSPIVRLVQTDPVVVSLVVSDREVVALREGMAAVVRAASAPRTFEGTVSHIGPAADLRTRSFPVEVEVSGAGEALRPGMIARVEIDQVLQTEAVAIPQDWVVTRGTNRGVFLVDGTTAVWRDVEILDIIGEQLVLTGVSPGERVIITGHRELLDGDEILVSREGICCTDGRPQF